MNSPLPILRASVRTTAAIGLVAGLAVVVPAATASAATAVTAPDTIYYGEFGPETPVTVGFTTDSNAAITHVEVEGTVVGASCTSGGSDLATTVIGGAAVIEALLPATTVVSCDLTLGLALPASPPASGDIDVIEHDVFSNETARGTSPVDFEPVDVDFVAGALQLNGGAYVPFTPRAMNDELSYTLGVAADTAVLLSVGSVAGTTVGGCPPATTTALNCTLTRSLGAADFIDLAAPMSATVFADGFPIAVFERSVDVFVERRLGLDITVDPVAPAVGDQLSISLDLENQGTIELTDFVLTGGSLGNLDCSGSSVAALTLAPGQTVTCTSSRTLSNADLVANTPILVRATSLVPGDSDLVDDDLTFPDDVDASLPIPFEVAERYVEFVVELDDDIVWLPTPAVAGASSTASTTGSVTIKLDQVPAWGRFEMPLYPAPGVTITGCDDIIGTNVCRFENNLQLWNTVTEAGSVRGFGVDIDAAAIEPAGLVDVELGARLIADGDIDRQADPALLSASGVEFELLTTGFDVTGETTEATIRLSTRPGPPIGVVLEPIAGATVDSCTGPDGALTIAAGIDTFGLGTLAASSDYTCDLTLPVTAADRSASTFAVDLGITLLDGLAAFDDEWSDQAPSRSITVTALAPAATPPNGYDVEGDHGRPHSVVQGFQVKMLGAAATSTGQPVVDSDDAATCVSTAARTWRCDIERDLTQADLDLGHADLGLDVSLVADGMTLSGEASARVELPFERFEVTVTELSSPSSAAGYWVDETIHVLVQVQNTGTMPVSFDGVTVDGAASAVRSARSAPIDTVVTLQPGETYDASIDIVVSAADLVAGEAALSITVGSGAIDQTVVLRMAMTLDPPPPPAPPVPPAQPQIPLGQPGGPVTQLPATGTHPMTIVSVAGALLLVGLVLRSRLRPRLRVEFTAN
ncbi:MAG: hypothetical protein ACE37B_18395 [Ilumatobacter sp.]|uniref:DUF7507 domain-containing protein n=1 Tax=Ilumatobacter sp. TaxID=1967498 RepID=UPI003919C539